MRHCLSFFSWLHVSFEMSVTDSLFFCCKNIMLNKKHYKLTFSTIFRTVFEITCMYCVFTNISAFCILQASHSHSFASEMDLSSAMPRCSWHLQDRVDPMFSLFSITMPCSISFKVTKCEGLEWPAVGLASRRNSGCCLVQRHAQFGMSWSTTDLSIESLVFFVKDVVTTSSIMLWPRQ